MRFMVISDQVPNLTEEHNTRLYRAMNLFYKNIPNDVILEGDFIRADRKGSYSVLTVPDRGVLDRILAPYEGLIKVEVQELLPARGQS